MDDEKHLGVDMAAHLKSSGSREFHHDILAGLLFVGVEVQDVRLDVDLMDEFVLIGEGERIALGNGHLARMKGPALLDDRMAVIGERHASDEQDRDQGEDRVSHLVTTSCCIGARRARKRFWVAKGTPALSSAS